ncbi:10574_t:CDS:2, partial [Cetraspora pellucida]
MSHKNSPPAEEDTIMLDDTDRESVVGPEEGPVEVNWKLVERLEDFWNESEEVEKLQKGGNKESVQPSSSERQEYDILRFTENRLEEKIESKFESAVTAVLERNLQHLASQFRNLQEVSVETKFPEKKFKRMRDQHEYDFVCQVGKVLTKAIQEESMKRVHEAFNVVKIRAFTLRTAEDEGWRVAANIPKPAPTEKDELYELLIEARKQAKPKEHKPFQSFKNSYNRGGYLSKGPSSQYFTPYPQVQDLWQGPSFMSANKRSSQLKAVLVKEDFFIRAQEAEKTNPDYTQEGNSDKKDVTSGKLDREKEVGLREDSHRQNSYDRGDRLLAKSSKSTTDCCRLVVEPYTIIPKG